MFDVTKPEQWAVRWGQSSHDNLHAIQSKVDDRIIDFERVMDATDYRHQTNNTTQLEPLDRPISRPGANRRPLELSNSPGAESEAWQDTLVDVEPIRESERADSTSSRPTRAAAEASRDATKALFEEHAALSEEAVFERVCQRMAEGETEASGREAIALSATAGFYGYEPATYQEATTCPDANEWRLAMEIEMEALERLGVFEEVPLSAVPQGYKSISNKWVYKIKPDKYKARLVIRGFMERDPGETFAPTLKMVTLRLIFALAAVMGFILRQMDVCNAFVNASTPSETPIYTPYPQGFKRDGYTLRLLKALYGLKGSPRAWYYHLRDFLSKLGMIPSELDVCLFVMFDNGALVLIVAVYVDDLIIAGLSNWVKWFMNEIKKEFLMDDLGEPKRILGIDVEFTDEFITLNQTSYIEKVLTKFKFLDCTPKNTPMEAKLKLTADDQWDNDQVGNFPYRSLVACLLYLSICVRFDIAFAVKELCRFMEKPGTTMVAAAKRVLRYLKGTSTIGLRFHRIWRSDRIVEASVKWSPNAPIKGFTDADWAGQVDTRKSTEGLILLFNGTAISWWYRTIRTVALSSQDAEYMGLSDGSREVIFIRQMLHLMNFKLDATELLGDNNGSLAISNNPAAHQKTKHIQVRYHFIRQKIEDKEIKTVKVSTELQLADIMTKALCWVIHKRLTLLAAGSEFGGF
jgi:hypothetical protein